MARLRSLWVVAPLFAGACSLVNAPAEILPGPGGGGGEGGSGGTTTSDSTTSSTTTTAPPDECGDGKKTGSEECDDDNLAPGDGCGATCTEENGFTCTGEEGGLSTCEKDCGNGAVDALEECDDSGDEDVNPAPGDQDACNAQCRFKELDLEAADTMVTYESPVVGFRRDKPDDMEPEEATFFATWHATVPDKVRARRYRRDALPLLGTGSEDISGTNTPDPSGHVMCTASSNRSLVFWRHTDEGNIYARKIESSGVLQPIVGVNIPQAQPNPSCAASPENDAFIVATTGKASGGTLWDVFVQPFTSFALPQGNPIDIGDTTGPNNTAAWPLATGFMVSWVVDAINGGGLTGQLLDKNGLLVAGAVHPMSDPLDVKVGEPFAARVATMANDSSFVFGYTREAMDGHREVVVRAFQWTDLTSAPAGGAPTVVSAEMTLQGQPHIAVNPMNGKFVVVWTTVAAGGEDVLFRTFDQKANPLSPETKAPENLIGKQSNPSAAVDPATGDVFIIWSNDNPSDTKPGRISGKMFPKLLQ